MSNDRPRNYRDLIVWQAAIQLAADVDVVCKQLPRTDWKLIQQMREAARSVHSAIAEGNGRFSIRDYLRFLSMSNASLQELQGDLIRLQRSKPSNSIRTALNRTYFVAKLLMRLVESLRRKRDDDEAA